MSWKRPLLFASLALGSALSSCGMPADPTCLPRNCSGCCDKGTCSAGNTAAACGAGGMTCQACVGLQFCQGGVCATPGGGDGGGGDAGGVDGGGADAGLDGGAAGPCTSTSCPVDAFCHPTARVCVKTCSSGAGCPDTAKNCAAFPDGGAGGQKFCQCATTPLCGGGSIVCSVEDLLCSKKCISALDCQGRTCNAANGQCGSATGSDAGTDAGTDAGLPCTPACLGGKVCDPATANCVDPCFPGYCATGKVCNYTTGLCLAPQPCAAANFQPDACYYGELCAGAACQDVPPTTCPNFTPGSGKTPVWDPTTDSGPIIYGLTKVSFAVDTAFCGTGSNTKRVKVHVKAYATSGVLLSETNQPALRYVKEDGSEISVAANQTQSFVATNGGQNAEFDINFCAPTTSTEFRVGLYYLNGNEICFLVQ